MDRLLPAALLLVLSLLPAASQAESPRVHFDLPYAIAGSPETVRSGIEAMVRKTQADELMVITLIRDPVAARRSYEIVANVCRDITREPARLTTG